MHLGGYYTSRRGFIPLEVRLAKSKSAGSKTTLPLTGFTLIELLVVIAIIAVLASVILISINSAGNKGIDSSVKGNLATVVTQSNLYFDTNVNSYGAANTSCTPAGIPSVFRDTNIAAAIAKADADNSPSRVVVCTSATSTYMVAAQLSNNSYWCVDYTGIKKVTSRVPLTSDASCP